MSRFYASIQGEAKTEVTRTGTPTSGITSHTRNWDTGVRVIGGARINVEEENKDYFFIYATYGSNASGPDFFLGTVQKNSKTKKTEFIPSEEQTK